MPKNSTHEVFERPKQSKFRAKAAETETVLVTGSCGFIGSHLVSALLASGVSVIGVDIQSPWRDASAATYLFRHATNPFLRFSQQDITEVSLESLLNGVHTVFHLAGISGVRESWGDQFQRYADTNVVGTQRLLEACSAAGVQRVVLASSSSVYGSARGRASREADLPLPLSPYGVSKLAAERLALAYGLRSEVSFDVIALRYFTVYGPGQRSNMLMAQALNAALTQVPVTVFGDGSQRRNFTFVDDAVSATVKAGSQPLSCSTVVNVAGPRTVSVREVIAAAERVTGRGVPVRFESVCAGDVETTDADLDLACSTLGYRPRVDIEQGLATHWGWLLRAARPQKQFDGRAVSVIGGSR